MYLLTKDSKNRSKICICISFFLVLYIGISIFMPMMSIQAEEEDPLAGKCFMIKSRYSGLYMDVKESLKNQGTPIIQFSKNSPVSKNQIFKIVPASQKGYYKIVDQNSGLVFDLYGSSNNKNERTIIYYDYNQSNQQFKFNKQSDGSYKIQVRHSGQYLTIKDDSKNNNANIVQWPLKTSGADNQAWYLEEVKTSYKNFDDFLNFQVKVKKLIDTEALLKEAKANGFPEDPFLIRIKVNDIINKQNPTDIFTDSTGFVTTYGMLNKRIDEIGFASPHNAFSNNEDRRSSYAWDTYKTGHDLGTENHNISIGTMLNVGYRIIDLDIGDNGNGKTGSYHRYRLSGYSNLYGNNSILPKIKKYLDDNPGEIVIIYLSDVYNGTIDLTKLKNNSIYHKGEDGWLKQVNNLLDDMQKSGLMTKVYNFNGTSRTSHDLRYDRIQVVGKDIPYPTLKDMIQNDKRVLFMERDAGATKDIWFNCGNDPNEATKDRLSLSDNLVNELTGSCSNRIVNINCMHDWGASAGDLNAAKINNNGRRIYEILTRANKYFKDRNCNKVVNSISVDYATGNISQGGFEEVSPVDAINRANFDNLGYPWTSSSVGRWFWK